jgi:hypothetical protein
LRKTCQCSAAIQWAFGVALGTGGEHDDVLAAADAALGVEADEGEHLAADGFVAYPEDEVLAELYGLDDVGKLVKEGASALDVHGVSL